MLRLCNVACVVTVLMLITACGTETASSVAPATSRDLALDDFSKACRQYIAGGDARFVHEVEFGSAVRHTLINETHAVDEDPASFAQLELVAPSYEMVRAAAQAPSGVVYPGGTTVAVLVAFGVSGPLFEAELISYLNGQAQNTQRFGPEAQSGSPTVLTMKTDAAFDRLEIQHRNGPGASRSIEYYAFCTDYAQP